MKKTIDDEIDVFGELYVNLINGATLLLNRFLANDVADTIKLKNGQIFDLIERLDNEQKTALEATVRYFVQLTLFELLYTLENGAALGDGVTLYKFKLKMLNKITERETTITEYSTFRELDTRFWQWLEEYLVDNNVSLSRSKDNNLKLPL